MTARTYVAPVSFGLGDLVVSLPAIQAVIAAAHRESSGTWLVARSTAQALLAERVDGLAGSVPAETFDPNEPAAACGRFVDLRDHPLQRDHWWGSAEFVQAFGPIGINEILGRICVDLGIDADFTRPARLRSSPRPEVATTVLLVTETDGPSKRWPAERWASLADSIRSSGLAARRIVRSAGSGDEVEAPTPGDAVDLLTSCRAVVGVDTGLTHIAAQQGTPTVTIGRRDDVFFRPWPHCRRVTGDACDAACASARLASAHNHHVDLRTFAWRPWTCPVGARCLDPVSPARVAAALRELL